MVVRLPPPKTIDEKFYQIHGLYVDQDEAGWDTAWRSFRASLFHLSLHAACSNFRAYAPWARSREVGAATFAVSLVEDVNILTEARAQWSGVLADLAYASYLSSLRLPSPDEIAIRRSKDTTRYRDVVNRDDLVGELALARSFMSVSSTLTGAPMMIVSNADGRSDEVSSDIALILKEASA